MVKKTETRETTRRRGVVLQVAYTPEQYRLAVEKKAFEIYRRRTEIQQAGDELSDWVQAEEEIRQGLRQKTH